jgi:hypothetical protein
MIAVYRSPFEFYHSGHGKKIALFPAMQIALPLKMFSFVY